MNFELYKENCKQSAERADKFFKIVTCPKVEVSRDHSQLDPGNISHITFYIMSLSKKILPNIFWLASAQKTVFHSEYIIAF